MENKKKNQILSFILTRRFSTNHKDIGTFYLHNLTNLLTLNSFFAGVIPPKSLGKLSLLAWFCCNSTEGFFLASIFFGEILMFLLAVIGFCVIYIVSKRDVFFIERVIPHFYSLPLKKKLLFGGFTLFVAIPNKFWVNNKVNTWVIFMISPLVYIFGLVFPFIFIFVFVYVNYCIDSTVFSSLYEKSEKFKSFVNNLLFDVSTESFADAYFSWFWGNARKQSTKKLIAMGGGFYCADRRRHYENDERIEYATRKAAAAGPYANPDERYEHFTKYCNEWVLENGGVTLVELKLKILAKSVL